MKQYILLVVWFASVFGGIIIGMVLQQRLDRPTPATITPETKPITKWQKHSRYKIPARRYA